MTNEGSRTHVPRSTARLAVALFATLLVLVSMVPAAQASKLERERARAKAIARDVGDLDRQLEAAVASYAGASRRLAAVTERLEKNEAELTLARINLGIARQAARARAVAMYKERSVTLVDVVVGSSSFAELLTQLQFLSKLNDYDQDLVAELAETRREVAARQRRLIADQQAAAAALQEQKALKARLQSALGERKQTLSRLRGEIQRLEEALRRPVIQASPQTASIPDDDPQAPDAPSGGWYPLIKQAAQTNGISAEGMYRLMMSESGGVASVVGLDRKSVV